MKINQKESFTKIKIIVFTLDSEEEEKFNLFVSGPNARGRTSIIYQLFNKNQILWDYETLRKGEYLIEIVNKGTKENEFYLHLSKGDKKKDNINPEKIDKISMLLNEIDINVNQLRNKKKIEKNIKQIKDGQETLEKLPTIASRTFSISNTIDELKVKYDKKNKYKSFINLTKQI